MRRWDKFSKQTSFTRFVLWNIFAVKDFQGSLQVQLCEVSVYYVFISVCKCSINCFIRVYGNLCGELNHKITL